MKFKSSVYTQVSGSVGGLTYAHNKSGMYARARSIPTNPNTGFQQTVRSALTSLVTYWSSTLTGTQRAAWDLYAANVPVVNSLGDSVNLSGQQWFNACNVPRLQAVSKLSSTLTQVDSGPTTFDRGDFTSPTPTLSEASGLSLAYTVADDWANEDDAAMLVYLGQPRNAGRSFFKGPYRLVGIVEGDSVTPPTSPLTVSAANLTSLGFTVTQGQLVQVAVAVTRADGRLSTRRTFDVTVGA